MIPKFFKFRLRCLFRGSGQFGAHLAHEREFILSNAAAEYFKDHGITKLPSTKALQTEIQQLTSEQNARYKDYREKQRRVEELERVRSNLETVLGHKKEKRHELIPS